MILDSLENLRAYSGLNSGLDKAFAFLSRADLRDLATGQYEIEEDRIFAIIVNDFGETSKEEGLLEVHRKYVDIQFVLSGTDEMGWKPKALCTNPADEFDEESDAQNFNDTPDGWFAVQPNYYAIFFPEDAHMAMFSSGIIHKVIVKVAVDEK